MRQEDNAKPHIAKKARAYAKALFGRILEWPPQSPDLSPLDYCINDHLKKEVRKQVGSPAKPEDVRSAATEAIGAMPAGFTNNAIGHWAKRLQARRAACGGAFEYRM